MWVCTNLCAKFYSFHFRFILTFTYSMLALKKSKVTDSSTVMDVGGFRSLLNVLCCFDCSKILARFNRLVTFVGLDSAEAEVADIFSRSLSNLAANADSLRERTTETARLRKRFGRSGFEGHKLGFVDTAGKCCKKEKGSLAAA